MQKICVVRNEKQWNGNFERGISYSIFRDSTTIETQFEIAVHVCTRTMIIPVIIDINKQ